VIGWPLMLSLLPEAHAVGMNTNSPRFRSWKNAASENVTYDDYWFFVQQVVDMCFERLALDPQLWPEFIAGPLDDLSEELRGETYARLETLAQNDGSHQAIWDAVDKLWRRHREYPTAQWVLPELEIERLRLIAESLVSKNPLERHLWLFAGDYPDLGSRKRSDDYDTDISAMRYQALVEVWDHNQLPGILALAEQSDSPFEVGAALATLDRPVDMFDVATRLDDGAWGRPFATAFLSGQSRNSVKTLENLAARFEGNPLIQARILLVADELPSAWDALERLGPSVDQIYWKEFYPYGRGADFALANETAEKLGAHARPAMALDVLSHFHSGPVPIRTALVVNLFDQLLEEGDEQIRVLSSYEISGLFAFLRNSKEVSVDILARLEWQLLPVLETDPSSSTLQEQLAANPEFFVEVLSLVYRSRVDTENTITDQRKKLASNAWRLLHDWKIVPGTQDPDNSPIDEESLTSWIDRSRELLILAGREEVGELQIGQILAQAQPVGEDPWPPPEIRHVL
jgi:hypothetical protein